MFKNLKLFALTVLSTIIFSSTAMAAHDKIEENNENVKCKVVGISDGDTLTCLTNQKKQLKVRLASIDAPEKNQAFGQKSKQKLSDLIFGKEVIVSIEGKDKYERNIAEVFLLNNSVSVNYQMVFTGYAWAYDRYVKDEAYMEAQKLAQSNKIGLWYDKNPIKPEDFRRMK